MLSNYVFNLLQGNEHLMENCRLLMWGNMLRFYNVQCSHFNNTYGIWTMKTLVFLIFHNLRVFKSSMFRKIIYITGVYTWHLPQSYEVFVRISSFFYQTYTVPLKIYNYISNKSNKHVDYTHACVYVSFST